MEIPKNQAYNPSRNKKRQSPRADFHDYKAPGYYLITITAYPDTPRAEKRQILQRWVQSESQSYYAKATECKKARCAGSCERN